MSEQQNSLLPFYKGWGTYQELLIKAIELLPLDQLSLRAAPHLRSIGENALHIVGCRAYWFTGFLGEDCDEEMKVYAGWNKVALTLGAPVPTAAELAQGLDCTWQFMADCLARWSPADMHQTFPDDWDGKQVDLSRAWVVWHVIEHDLHHGGELSFTLGMHGLTGIDI